MLLGLSFFMVMSQAQAQKLTVAVASNFVTTLEALAPEFSAQTGIEVVIVSGSTGKLATQIQAGAPFDVFLSADDKATKALLGKNIGSDEFTYAPGRLVIYAPKHADAEALFTSQAFSHVAIANPKLAPYGVAAQQSLQELGFFYILQSKIVMGENISQAFAMAETGNAELAFVAASQVAGKAGSFWVVPANLYAPIRQNVVRLNDRPESSAFLQYLKSSSARDLIRAKGYDVP